MPSLPSRRGLLGGVVAGAVAAATGWLTPLRSADSSDAPQALETSVVNEHALPHEVSVRVGSGESAVEASASVDGTTSRDLASVLPEVPDGGESAGGEANAERYDITVSVDGRRRVSTTVPAATREVTIRIDVIGTVEIEQTTYDD
jgi:hypothetical protein